MTHDDDTTEPNHGNHPNRHGNRVALVANASQPWAPEPAVDIVELLDNARPAWHTHAACRGHVNVMFPAVRHRETSATVWAAATAICATCPVQPQCAEAGRNERHGVWGGHIRQPHRLPAAPHNTPTVADCLADHNWWTLTQLETATQLREKPVRTQLRALRRNGTRIDMRVGDTGIEYRQHPNT